MADTASLLTSPSNPEEKVDDRVFFGLLERAGSMGNYQKLTTLFWCVVGYLCGGLMLITPFLFFQDPYSCLPSELPAGSTCFDYVCGLEADKRSHFVPTPSMYSLANEFGDYRCAKEKMELDFVITMMYVGTVVGFLGLTLAGDLVGRKLLMVVCLGINVAGLLLVIFCANI